jgi:hypothetical protein
MAAPDLVESHDEDGFTPLHLAVIAGNMPLVTFLLANKADVNAVDNEKHTVVHWATGKCTYVSYMLRSIYVEGWRGCILSSALGHSHFNTLDTGEASPTAMNEKYFFNYIFWKKSPWLGRVS